jgi:hypothetical protein
VRAQKKSRLYHKKPIDKLIQDQIVLTLMMLLNAGSHKAVEFPTNQAALDLTYVSLKQAIT